jgi:hypothetical protein
MAIDLTRSDLQLLVVRASEARDNARALCGWARLLREESTSAPGSGRTRGSTSSRHDAGHAGAAARAVPVAARLWP